MIRLMKTPGLLVLLTMTGGLSGCLKTRSTARESDQRTVLQQQVTTLQKDNADSAGRLSEYDEDIRALRGRLEVLENRASTGGQEMESARRSLGEQAQGVDRKVTLLQESLSKTDAQNQSLTAEVLALKAEINALRAAIASGAATPAAPRETGEKADSFSTAKSLFEQKEWKKAILAFQKYRDGNPKGKNVAEATYLMGVSFQELGLKEEAKSFYDEVVANHSKSPEARKAKTRLKSLR